MKTHRWRKYFTFLVLTTLFLTACQRAAIEIAPQPDEPAGASTQPVEAAAETPVSEPSMVIAQAAPTGEGSVLPSVEMEVPAGWLIFQDDRSGYSLAFPSEWNVCQQTKYSWTFCDLQEDPAWMGFPLRLYVSVFPKDYTNSDWEVYNFIPTATIQEFTALSVGESRQKEPGSPRPEYISYTRLPDQLVAGSTAPVIENSRLWGIPQGTKERVVFLFTEDTTYILGMYYETADQLALFEQVLDHFQFPGN